MLGRGRQEIAPQVNSRASAKFGSVDKVLEAEAIKVAVREGSKIGIRRGTKK
jgi:hypothetical protein